MLALIVVLLVKHPLPVAIAILNFALTYILILIQYNVAYGFINFEQKVVKLICEVLDPLKCPFNKTQRNSLLFRLRLFPNNKQSVNKKRRELKIDLLLYLTIDRPSLI